MTERFERDPLIERVREALRNDPAASPDARAAGRVLQAVWASRRPSWWRRFADALRMTTFTRLGAGAVAVGALALGFVFRGAVTGAPEGAPVAAADAAAPVGADAPVRLASADAGEVVLVATQFVLDDAKARRVSLVGDFNGWKAGETPLVRLQNGLWTTTVPLPPGRHVYAFVIDDTLVKADPRAPKAGDADYGREGSVVMVFSR